MKSTRLSRIKALIKKEAVLCIAAALAVLSMFLVPPDGAYPGYIDTRTLCLLFSLMAVVAGFRDAGTFSALSHALLSRVKTARGVVLCLVLVCFFTSMLITNDVSLLTFVPLSILLLQSAGLGRLTLLTVTLQTVAANLGSMLTPIGNPQNLYLYALSGMGIGDFFLTLLPYAALSLALLVLACLFVRREAIPPQTAEHPARCLKTELLCAALFVLCLLCVLRVLESWVAALVTALALLVYKRRLLLRVDYGLLLTFVCFFVFIGNMGRIEPVRTFLSGFIAGREMLTGALLSQVISNVPAAMLLSAFTSNYAELLIGVNVGGLGTLIASLSSLISYKLYCSAEGARPKKYLLVFTAVNAAFFVLLTILWFFLKNA